MPAYRAPKNQVVERRDAVDLGGRHLQKIGDVANRLVGHPAAVPLDGLQGLDAGTLTPELARIVPHKNILTQSVGYHGPVEPDTSTRPIEPGDVFILCSDGLTDPLDDEALADICRETAPEDLAEVLVQKAIENGTEDNVTVVVAAL